MYMLTSPSAFFNESRTLVFKLGFVQFSAELIWVGMDPAEITGWSSHTNQHVKTPTDVDCQHTDGPACVVLLFVQRRRKIIPFMKGKCDEDAFLSELEGNGGFLVSVQRSVTEMLRIILVKQLTRGTMYAQCTRWENGNNHKSWSISYKSDMAHITYMSLSLSLSATKSTKDAVIMLSQAIPTAFINSGGLC